MLLVDDDQAEARNGREHGGARPHDDPGLTADDARPLVAPLGVGERRMEDRDAIAEPGADPADRLGRQGDLGHEDDRAQPALEHCGAGQEVHLGLAASGRAVQQEVAAAAVDRRHDPLDRGNLRRRGDGCGRLVDELLPLRGGRLLLTALRRLRRDERQRPGRRRAVVVGQPQRQLDQRGRNLADHGVDRLDLNAGGHALVERDDDPTRPRAAERHPNDRADPHALRNLVREGAGDGARGHERKDRCVRHQGLGCSVSSARDAARSRLNENVRVITPTARSPSTTLRATSAMFIPTLNASNSALDTA